MRGRIVFFAITISIFPVALSVADFIPKTFTMQGLVMVGTPPAVPAFTPKTLTTTRLVMTGAYDPIGNFQPKRLVLERPLTMIGQGKTGETP